MIENNDKDKNDVNGPDSHLHVVYILHEKGHFSKTITIKKKKKKMVKNQGLVPFCRIFQFHNIIFQSSSLWFQPVFSIYVRLVWDVRRMVIIWINISSLDK